MAAAENEEIMKAIAEWKEDWSRNIRTISNMVLTIKDLLDAAHGARDSSRLPYTSLSSSVEDDMPTLPSIFDDPLESTRKRRLEALKHSIQRKRKLSAEDMLKIYVLHKEKHVSFRKIAKQFTVSEWTIRKTYSKVTEILANV